MSVSEKFLKYVKVNTQSSDESLTTPSTMCQFDLAKILEKECIDLGFDAVYLSESGIVYATLNATVDGKDSIGFLAHMDTATEISGANVHPRIVKEYAGDTIHLNEEYSMSPDEFEALSECIGDDLIITDGTTLLGGDDKAGIAIIMEAMETLIQSKKPHGKIMVAFTCDEEVGRGTESFELDRFDVDYAYTVDGGRVDCIDYENFNAARATIHITGTSIHPGDAKGKMINAALLAGEVIAQFPIDQTPATTEDREGFYHLLEVKGNVENATLDYILREHDSVKFEAQKVFVQEIVQAMNAKYPGHFQVEIRDQYLNMYAYIKEDMRCVHRARKAIATSGLDPVSIPVRGGTDGAMLSNRGLLCPNLGTGSYNHHGRFEFASIQKMEKMVEIVMNIIEG